jgi:hypothetical protein
MRISPFYTLAIIAFAAFSSLAMPESVSAAQDPEKKPEARKTARKSTIPQGQNGLVRLSGRAVTPGGQFIRNAAVMLMDADTGAIRGTVSGSLGYYQISGIVPGRMYILMVAHARYLFASPTQFIEINGDIQNVILIGELEPIL